ncbi:MAG: hypothetical protein COU10_02455 [Candidatus Harrisonbacteria bacterium CG10_big_fil_rev_8_21_14_0_10_45_28]|uniref:Uncharacterized protein n=1 Tax=Candidatus Harrisonbacteria bacterium CG10_big_fil_rev_8_21_14_0_10_45_28 TaxID=1974586 RepID=A0A2H0UN34_9BACT|nr:MAG: hypothetical protein COU10_02455 [Candidatus Harrisonbacteria bacterium CG10_big_fil_rev_8_21_14_0_10_45_28]
MKILIRRWEGGAVLGVYDVYEDSRTRDRWAREQGHEDFLGWSAARGDPKIFFAPDGPAERLLRRWLDGESPQVETLRYLRPDTECKVCGHTGDTPCPKHEG